MMDARAKGVALRTRTRAYLDSILIVEKVAVGQNRMLEAAAGGLAVVLSPDQFRVIRDAVDEQFTVDGDLPVGTTIRRHILKSDGKPNGKDIVLQYVTRELPSGPISEFQRGFASGFGDTTVG